MTTFSCGLPVEGPYAYAEDYTGWDLERLTHVDLAWPKSEPTPNFSDSSLLPFARRLLAGNSVVSTVFPAFSFAQ